MRCPFATWVGSPNYWPGRLPLESIVDHIAQGKMAGIDGWFHNPDSDASSHFAIGKKGEIHQYVDTEDSAWANGVLLKPDLSVLWIVQAAASKTIAEYWARHPNRRTISIEHEGFAGELWTEAMFDSDLRLKRWLLETHQFGQEGSDYLLLGHYQFDSVNRRQCPGTGWPQARIIAALKEFSEEKEEDMLWVVKGSKPTHWVTNGVFKCAMISGALHNELVAKGFVSKAVIEVSDALLGMWKDVGDVTVIGGPSLQETADGLKIVPK